MQNKINQLQEQYGRFYGISEIAELLSVNVTTIRRAIYGGKLKGVKLNNLWRVRESDLNDFLKDSVLYKEVDHERE